MNGRTWRGGEESEAEKLVHLHASSAIDANDFAVDPLTILGGQEGGDTGNINGHTDTVHGGPGGRVLVNLCVVQVFTVGDVLLADGVVHVGLDTTGGHSVDGDLLVSTVNGHAADKGLDGTLAAGVDGVLGDTLGLTGDGAHQDDAASNLEVLVCFSCDEELSSGVDGEDTIKLLGGDILQVAEGDDTGVGDDNVDLAKVFLGLGKEVDDLVDIADVALNGDGVSAEGLDLSNELVSGLGGVGIVDNDIGTTAGKFEGGLTTHSSSYQENDISIGLDLKGQAGEPRK